MRPGQNKKQANKPQPQSGGGFCGWLVWMIKWGTISFSIFVILLYTGVLTQLGAFKWLDTFENADGNQNMKGIGPATHYGIPFGFTLDEIEDGGLKGKNIIVTGANTGLGFSSVVALVSKGAHVVMACRSQGRCDAAAEKVRERVKGVKGAGEGIPMLCDLGDLESVRGFAESFLAKYNKLDSLMLNAGIMMTPYQLTKQGIESQIGVNHFGHFYLTSLLLPLLRSSATPSHPTTIVSVSSSAHFRPYDHGVGLTLEKLNNEEEYDGQQAYGQSKLANVLFTLELAEKEKGNNVLVNVIHPGAVETELPRYIVDQVREKIGPLAAIPEFLISLLQAALWDSDTAALTQVYTSVGPKLLEEKITGKYYHPIARETTPHKKFAQNKNLREGLWALSEQVVRDFEGQK